MLNVSLTAVAEQSRQPARWAKAWIPYFIIFVTSYWTQLTLYWILGTFSNEVETSSRAGGVFRAFEVAGQAVSYGLSSSKTIGASVPLYINCALLILSIPSMIMLVRKVPEASSTAYGRGTDAVVLEASQKEC